MRGCLVYAVTVDPFDIVVELYEDILAVVGYKGVGSEVNVALVLFSCEDFYIEAYLVPYFEVTVNLYDTVIVAFLISGLS